MKAAEIKRIISEVTDYYLGSRDFNGTHIKHLETSTKIRITPATAKQLITSGSIEFHFGHWGHPNPFIKALELGDTESQLKQLVEVTKTHDLNNSVLYPTKAHLKTAVDEAKYKERPYTLELALGEPQLHVRHFQPGIMVQYRDDPRYYYQFEGNCGTVFVKDEAAEMHEDDEIYLKSFGAGFHRDYEANHKTSIMCFLCDLSTLSSIQQQQWKLKELPKSDYKIDYAFAQSQIFGSFDFDATMYEAFIAELRIINQMSKAINGKAMFKNGFENYERAPRNFHRLLIPTRKEYQSFVETLDKLMSDNLNPAFFSEYMLVTESVTKSDSSVVFQPIPTIKLLETFLRNEMKFSNTEPIDEIAKSFRKVRRIRSKSSHNNLPDEFGYKFNDEQQKTMFQAYSAVRLVRLAIANYPQAKKVNVPDWLYKGNIFPR